MRESEEVLRLRCIAESLRRQGKGYTAGEIDGAANQIETLSEQVRRLEAEIKELKAKGKE